MFLKIALIAVFVVFTSAERSTGGATIAAGKNRLFQIGYLSGTSDNGKAVQELLQFPFEKYANAVDDAVNIGTWAYFGDASSAIVAKGAACQIKLRPELTVIADQLREKLNACSVTVATEFDNAVTNAINVASSGAAKTRAATATLSTLGGEAGGKVDQCAAPIVASVAAAVKALISKASSC